MVDRTLPNGRILSGVPDDLTNEELKQYALVTGAATEEDYNRDLETNADYLSLVGEVGGAVAGASYGASIGTALLPGFGTVLGGAVGAGLGYFAGELAESYVEDRDFNLEQATEESLKAAATDAVFGAGFGVLAKGIKNVWTPVRNSFEPQYLRAGTETEAGQAALAIQRGETTLEEIANSGEVSAEFVEIIVKNLSKREEELVTSLELQRKLEARGTSMMPKQAVPEDTVAGFAQDYSKASQFIGKTYDDLVEGQEEYIVKQFDEVLGASTASKTREETGIALAKLVKDADKALYAQVDPIYKAIDKEGSVSLGMGSIKNSAKRAFNASANKSSTSRSALSAIDSIPARLSPAEVTTQIRKLKDIAARFPPDEAVANKMIAGAIKNLQTQLKRHPRLVRPKAAITRGREALKTLVTREGTTGLLGQHKKMATKLSSLRDDMSFHEAHLELSELKAMQRDAASSVGEKNSKAESLINRAIGDIEDSMQQASSKFNPALQAKYNGVKNMYKEGVNTIHGDWIVKALKKDNVADIGQYIVKAGENISVKQVKALIAKAKELKVDNAGENLLESIERQYINNLFPNKTVAEGMKFMSDMKNDKFADTFKAIVGKEKADKLKLLSDEIELLARGIDGSEAALSLSVRSGELSQLRKPSAVGALLYPLVGAAARSQLKGANVTKKLNLAKAAVSQLKAGKTPSKGILIELLGKKDAGQLMGILAASPISQE